MSQKLCPQCQTPVTDELPGGLCPACLMAAARQSMGDLAETAAMTDRPKLPQMEEMRRLFPELEVIELIGQGGMGVVYRVRQVNLDRVVALKVFLYRPDDPEFAARFQREARALAKLNHPNIVTVHDFGQREKVHYLIMEFVDGLNLRQLTESEELDPEVALKMVPQVCDALQYAHDNGVIHRDIKPENLLLDSAGNVKIADFGLAKMTGHDHQGTLTHTRQVMGTLNYMAPEQRERPTEVDHRADIYSLGVVIYEMLTGELPIGRFLPPSEKSSLDARLDEAVLRALEKEPNRRYQQASEFKTGLTGTNLAAAAAAAGTAGFVPLSTPVSPTKHQPNTFGKTGRGTKFSVACMSGVEKKGNWQPGNPQIVVSFMGGSKIDLSQVKDPEINMHCFTMMGGTEIITPADAEVEVDGLLLMGATDEKTIQPEFPSGQKIRIHSWGMMGGCEIKSARVTAKKPVKGETHPYRHPRTHELTIRNGLVYMYKFFAYLIGMAAVIFFVAYRFDVFEDGKLAGIIAAITCGMAWAGLDYFRRLVGAGPESDDEASIKAYYSSSVIGTLIRCFALICGFACPILFVIASFDPYGDNDIRLVAIICAIVSAATYLMAGYVEEFLYGKLKD
ncbi:MAG: protein kinase [Planctomycetota bacterium]